MERRPSRSFLVVAVLRHLPRAGRALRYPNVGSGPNPTRGGIGVHAKKGEIRSGFSAFAGQAAFDRWRDLLAPVIHSRAGDATKIELYVPTVTPTTKANAKPWMPSPPMKYRIRTTINVVNEVSIVRLKVWLMLLLIMSPVRSGLFPRTSRIRSKTTIVSFNE